jgi:hypothetical protein
MGEPAPLLPKKYLILVFKPPILYSGLHLMSEEFKIYIDRLRGGKTQRIEGIFPSDLLDIEEDGIRFNHPVKVSAEVYLAEDHLVIGISASTVVEARCACCNEFGQHPLIAPPQTLTEPLSEIKGAIFDFGPTLRSALLLELPIRIECRTNHCPAKNLFKTGE